MTDFEPDKTAVFEAILPSIQGAIRFGDGQTRIQLDISEEYLEEAKKLLTMNNQALDVMIKVKQIDQPDIVVHDGNLDGIEFIGK